MDPGAATDIALSAGEKRTRQSRRGLQVLPTNLTNAAASPGKPSKQGTTVSLQAPSMLDNIVLPAVRERRSRSRRRSSEGHGATPSSAILSGESNCAAVIVGAESLTEPLALKAPLIQVKKQRSAAIATDGGGASPTAAPAAADTPIADSVLLEIETCAVINALANVHGETFARSLLVEALPHLSPETLEVGGTPCSRQCDAPLPLRRPAAACPPCPSGPGQGHAAGGL